MKRKIIQGGIILYQQQWLKNAALVIDDEKITAIIEDQFAAQYQPAQIISLPNHPYVVPGFIDLHIHGANGKDVMDSDDNALAVISNALAQEGITGFLATTLTANEKVIEKVISNIQKRMTSLTGATLLGMHLEGPFIAEAKAGAHDTATIQLPNKASLERWQKLANGMIKVITLAPELPAALELIAVAHELNIMPSIGHSNATYAETMRAIEAGAKHGTHLFNAMRALQSREPGTVGALLLHDEVNVELIMDGWHLHPAIADLTLRLKGKDKIILVTDSMRAKCLADGHYRLGTKSVAVTEGKAMLADGTLAGSTLKMPQAIRNMMQFSHCGLIDAITMATVNPARVLNLLQRKGSIDIGKDADIVALDNGLKVLLTMCAGKIIFTAPEKMKESVSS